jgi:hypothetical protein
MYVCMCICVCMFVDVCVHVCICIPACMYVTCGDEIKSQRRIEVTISTA